ncbi:hypothetical protein TVAG_146940 [Trichomonas vaginalis G3]|uniref:Uncharacterized protein n=1 Tax=Trichomonas vaginalis (strain ATCC PRA-98 / G3) TaxID=412133 RepID=A2DKZ7_TRIV3|nr:transforming growth factor beta regulated gene 1 family protein [Trichomonas vaginalis G3]EAY18950.1 hypothetical protein TVAG_146940 [Trichomonas vaginalis G3]KAI5532016.1 transforming growth factor beta regulated gene 1 family protein [Trichomonas vaginalis G3]|eukprot:XP_001579936.1 hypothetical protein [Trichomonas vaginalis G3]
MSEPEAKESSEYEHKSSSDEENDQTNDRFYFDGKVTVNMCQRFKRERSMKLLDGTEIELPYILTPSVRIISFGKYIEHPNFQVGRYSYNPGYICEREYFSTRCIDEYVTYRSIIFNNCNHPYFVVFDTRYKEIYEATSPSGCWIQIVNKSGWLRLGKRNLTVSGPQMYAFAFDKVTALMRRQSVNTPQKIRSNLPTPIRNQRRMNVASNDSRFRKDKQSQPEEPKSFDLVFHKKDFIIPANDKLYLKWPEEAFIAKCVPSEFKIKLSGMTNEEFKSFLEQDDSE